ncbi:hypothetical protein N9917_00015 [Deltaproteobacteria bacterium]|nr:hypothetical protein [Deltaproteobacteria bacterium]
MNLRQARKTRRNFYRAYRAMEAWRQYKWDRDDGPVFAGIIGKMSGHTPEPKPLVVPPLLKKLRKWPKLPSQRLMTAALRRLNREERVEWSVDIALWNAMVKQETTPLTWANAYNPGAMFAVAMEYTKHIEEEPHAQAG